MKMSKEEKEAWDKIADLQARVCHLIKGAQLDLEVTQKLLAVAYECADRQRQEALFMGERPTP